MGCALTRAARCLWAEQVTHTPRDPLPGDLRCDVAVVGGGFTGLWTAYYLARDAELDVVVIEGEHVGFGASGRNGGWCSALFPASPAKLARLPGSSPAAALRLHRALCDTVAEVGRASAEEGIDAGFAAGGSLSLARTPAQLTRARAAVAEARARGRSDLTLLSAEDTRRRVRSSGTLGATYSTACAAVHPAALVHGLARAGERRGITVVEGTRARAIEPGRVRTDRGVVTARHVIRATEGFTPALRGQRRTVAPLYSLMIATEPLPEDTWDRIGLAQRETFTDLRHLVVYGQRTADGRIAFGGRGAPYHLGSRTRPAYDADPRVFRRLHETLVELFPVLHSTRITHAWGGALGVPRDWCPSVGLDRATGVGWAGGYVGDGVATANLAGRTLCDLVLGRETPLTALPWVGHRSPRWEPEPLRWLGINAGLRAMRLADVEEVVTRRPSLIARRMAPLVGG